ncbi:Predicted kinase [Burkholderia sp. b13]|nr:Predicted kinase [Burkholderia sp. b13]
MPVVGTTDPHEPPHACLGYAAPGGLRAAATMTRLLFFCGHAGAGKTTLAKQLVPALLDATREPLCLLDKDTLYGRYSAVAMQALTHDPNDRDSPVYLQTLRDPEYQGLLDTARENVSLGISAVVVGPLSREVRDRRIFDRDWLRVPAHVDVRWVWVSVSEHIARERIVRRSNANDAYKLAHWEIYRQRRFEPNPADYPQLLIFDNDAPCDADRRALQDRLLAPAHSVEPFPLAAGRPPFTPE